MLYSNYVTGSRIYLLSELQPVMGKEARDGRFIANHEETDGGYEP